MTAAPPLDLKEVAARLGIQYPSLLKRIQRREIGTLPIFRTGDGPRSRWACRAEELEAWIQVRKGVV